ncbi:MAG: hypothetical protein GY866_15560 [Proteobacteria bacterium]|nr:hypothetical protein [Pseudomonadota bacterium]
MTHEEQPVFVPTGVFVQSIEFTSANNVILTGYIWQKYDVLKLKNTSRAVVFPEAEDVTLKEAYRQTDNKTEVIGWYFKAKIRESFSYSRFPFDRENVWIRIWHADFCRNIILTPDLEAYDFINPSFNPGIEQDFVLSGWKIAGSYYSCHQNSYNTNFGISDHMGQEDFPELYLFHVVMIRKMCLGSIH